MSIQDVENYLLKVGASKYRDEVVKKQFPNFTSISHFGIGILTCFMVANDIDIVTSSDEQEEANSINLRKVNGSYLLRKNGTCGCIHDQPDVSFDTTDFYVSFVSSEDVIFFVRILVNEWLDTDRSGFAVVGNLLMGNADIIQVF